MKVLQINATYGTGSTGEIICGIAHAGIQRGIETYFASSVPSNEADKKRVFVVGNTLDHKIHALCSRVFGSQGMYSVVATKKLLNWIDEIKPEVIHLHNLHNNYINIPLLFTYIKRKKIQTVITLHDCWFFTGKCCHFLYDDCNKWKSGCGKCPRLKKEIPSYFFDRSASNFKKKRRLIGKNVFVHVVGCSNWLTNCARTSLLAERVENTIYNGIDLQVFKPYDMGKNEELRNEGIFVIMGMANKWLTEDGKETYGYILKKLEPGMKLLLIGCSSKQIRENTNENVIMRGFITERSELAKCYSSADVFVNVTRADSLPTVNIESIACGTPVITYDSGGSAEIVDEETGDVVPYGDYRRLFQSIMKLKQNGKQSYFSNCRKRAEQLYNRDQRFLEYIDLYQRICDNG